MRFVVYAILFICCFMPIVNAANISLGNMSDISSAQIPNTQPKLYAPHFIMIGSNATFKVFTLPNKPVKLMLDYGYSIDKTIITKNTNDKGVVVFEVIVPNNKDLIGKSVGVDAWVINEANSSLNQKAVRLNDKGGITNSNRVDIADNNSAKGFVISPSQTLNEFLMNVNYDEKSGFDPFTDRIYDNKTPVYVKNMRDAQENVREIPENFSNTNR